MDLPFFFLDFDGVVCDSLPECFISSRRAYHEHLKGESLPPATAREKELFHRYRPFIRNGEDYLLLHDLIARGVEVHVQEDLDREIASRGRETMDRYGRLFYRAREEFLREDREFWLELNPLFPGMGEILEKVLGHPKFYILSTKKAEFILEILAHHRIPWREDRVIFSGPRPKGEVIRDLLAREGGGEAVFVDDQLDHLLTAGKMGGIRTYLASWGYVKPRWLENGEVPALDREGLAELVEPFRFPAPPDSRRLSGEGGIPWER